MTSPGVICRHHLFSIYRSRVAQISDCVTTHRCEVDLEYRADCETLRASPSMSSRTIRRRDEGRWSGVGGA